MRPTPRAVVLLAAGVPLAFALVLLDAALWPFPLAYLGAVVFLIGLDALLAPSPRRLAIATRLPPLLYIGDQDPMIVTLTPAAGGFGAVAEIVCDVGAELVPPPRLTTALVPGGATEVALPLFARRRGTVRVERLWLRWRGPLGLMWRHRRHAVAGEIPVTPNTRSVRAQALRFSARDAIFGVKVQYQQGSGSEFDALRDYAPGFDHRSIDWKHSARHRRPVCKEYRTERNHHVMLAFDTGHLMREPLAGFPKLDHAINAGLLLAYFSLRAGDRVGLFGFDAAARLFAEPVGGIRSFPRLQHALAGLAYQPDETNFTLGLAELGRRLRRRTLIILMTDFVDTVTAELMVENLERIGRRHLVVFVTLRDPGVAAAIDAAPAALDDVTRAVVAADFRRERMVVLERLRRLGVHCIDAPSAAVSVGLLARYLTIKERELL